MRWRVGRWECLRPGSTNGATATPRPGEPADGALSVLVAALFAGHRRTNGAPRITADLRESAWRVSQNTVAAAMAGQGLRARAKRRRRATTRRGKGRWRAPDLVNRDFAARRVNQRWFGDGTEIHTAEAKLAHYVLWNPSTAHPQPSN